MDEKQEAIENEEIKYIDIVSLGNLIIHQSQINGAKMKMDMIFHQASIYKGDG